MAKPRILLADSSRFFLKLQKGFLGLTDAGVLTAEEGPEALRIIREERPDLVFMDLHLPRIDGAACCREVKSDPLLCSIPVVLLCPEGDDDAAESCREARCNAVLTKPLERRRFLEAGRKLLSRVDRRQERISLAKMAVYRVKDRSTYGTLRDLSEGGAFIESEDKVSKGDPVQVSFTLPGNSSALIEAQGPVAWLNQGAGRVKPDLPQGFGIEFARVEERSRPLLQSFVSRFVSSGVASLITDTR